MPLSKVIVRFAETSHKRRLFVSGIQMGQISKGKAAKDGSTLVTLLRHQCCDRRRQCAEVMP